MLFQLPGPFMATESNSSPRPRPVQISKPFSRIEPLSPGSPSRSRSSTIQNGASLEVDIPKGGAILEEPKLSSSPDVFERDFDDDDGGPKKGETESDKEKSRLPSDFDELPIELISLSDSFIESLSAKVYSSPPLIDKLSSLFQEFYILAASHINTHISTLSSRQHRESSPNSSIASRSSTASRFRSKTTSASSKDNPKTPLERKDSDQQMLTVEEIADRKRARKLLEQKRVALEEAVEKRVCEGIYSRIWRHRSTQDEAQDEKLRSKTAALAVVGIGLKDLGVDLGDNDSEERENDVREWLSGAREELVRMNDEKYPLGKLQHLKAAHKAIVETLSHFHPSASADEIMPMLIYTLITSPPEGINVVSNLYFIQRFRSQSKIDGEAAYCLTTLEAAITFLETVDLASLRSDENLSGPVKNSSRPTTPQVEHPNPAELASTSSPGLSAATLSPPTVTSVTSESKDSSKPETPSTPSRPAIQVHNRRISDIFQPAQAFGAASDVVLNTADQGFKTIGSSLGESYKFLLGKLKERQESITDGKDIDIVVPKTLEDARKLVGTPPPEDDASTSGANSLLGQDGSGTQKKEDLEKTDDKLLHMIGGRKATRDRSVDSHQSSSSHQKSSLGEDLKDKEKEKQGATLSASLTSSNPALVESMRNLGNTLNPIGRFAGGMSLMRGFGRSATPSSTATPAAKDATVAEGEVTDLTTAFPDLAGSLPPKEVVKVAPPIKRFMEVQSPGELRLNEVLDLLRDYRRLAGALKDLGAF